MTELSEEEQKKWIEEQIEERPNEGRKEEKKRIWANK